jgi:hypothetical protein
LSGQRHGLRPCAGRKPGHGSQHTDGLGPCSDSSQHVLHSPFCGLCAPDRRRHAPGWRIAAGTVPMSQPPPVPPTRSPSPRHIYITAGGTVQMARQARDSGQKPCIPIVYPGAHPPSSEETRIRHTKKGPPRRRPLSTSVVSDLRGMLYGWTTTSVLSRPPGNGSVSSADIAHKLMHAQMKSTANVAGVTVVPGKEPCHRNAWRGAMSCGKIAGVSDAPAHSHEAAPQN